MIKPASAFSRDFSRGFRPGLNSGFCARALLALSVSFIVSFVSSFALSFATTAFAAEGGTELKKRSVLRVCADPSNLPFSNRKKEGFENRIAELVADELGIPLAYTWFPQTMGFVRLTLRARRCDLIIGISAAHELVQNTNPYYSSVFAIVQHKDAGYDIKSLGDDALRNLKIGVVAGTPPVDVLLEKELMDRVTPYHLRRADIRYSPVAQLGQDLLDKKVDVAVMWGPLAGKLVSDNAEALKLAPLTADNTQRHRLIFPITMGIRRGELQWRRELNRVLRRSKDKINAILNSYNVPVVQQ